VRLTPDQVSRYRRDGVLIVPNLLSEADQQPLIDELCTFIDRRARELQAEGKLAELHEDKGFENRFGYLHRQNRAMASGFDIAGILGEAMFAYLRHEKILDTIESLLGSEITCSPIHHIRPKLPAKNGASSKDLMGAVPWHQDAGVTLEEAEASEIVTVWMPLVDATRLTGCMQVLPGVSKLGYLEHVASDYGTAIDSAAMPGVAPMLCECPKGGAVLMNKFTPHMGLPNLTDETVRWTIDLRYQKAGTPTGRPSQPDFIARSRTNPTRELRDHAEWVRLWRESQSHAASKPPPKLHRVKS